MVSKMRSPARTFLVIVVVLVLIRPGATSSRNVTMHMGDREMNFLSPHLWETEEELQTWRIVAAVICGSIAAILSSAGGLGGGGLYVPIFNLLLGFSSKTSAALSSCMILGGTLVNLIWYSFQRRSDGHGPLIDYEVSLLCLPNVLLGITAGVMCNVASPGWLVTVILIIVLFFMTFRSCRNAIQRWNKETASFRSDLSSAVLDKDSVHNGSGSAHNGSGSAHNGSGSALDGSGSARNKTFVSFGSFGKDARGEVVVSPLLYETPEDPEKQSQDKELEKPLLEPRVKGLPQFPLGRISLLFFIWIAFLAVQVIRGSSDGQNVFGIQTCGRIYWLVTSSQIPFAIFVTALVLVYFQNTNEEQNSSTQLENDPFRGSGSMRLLPVLALLTGLLGGMLGLGGGMIISPLLLEMGMHPQVTAATCSYMVFFSSSLSVVQFWLLGRIPEEYALISASISLVFSVIGLQVIQTIITKYGRVSLIVFAVSTVMGISAVLMAFFGSWDVLIELEEGDYMGFRSPC